MGEIMKELELPWIKQKGVKTDEVPSMSGKKMGLMGIIRGEIDIQWPEFYTEHHCIIHRQSICGTFEV
jgi:hypothetical protein